MNELDIENYYAIYVWVSPEESFIVKDYKPIGYWHHMETIEESWGEDVAKSRLRIAENMFGHGNVQLIHVKHEKITDVDTKGE